MKKEYTNHDVEDWIKKIEKSKQGDVDLSRDEDLSIALMNLISLEEHFYFTAMKTNNQEYLELMKSIRDMRKKCQKVIVKNPQGEEWCISKHLLAASMRLYEVGVKELSTHGKEDADKFFRAGFELWSLFFAINLGIVNTTELNQKEIAAEQKDMSRFSALMKKIVDCCKEW
ncbi:MAG TPA: hypothetical protein DDW36_00555 [Candidatus Magasanikbacteria bacterium]|nr:hypothetical protein [Candidatus Magasanikbacteria bacterium]